MLFCTFFHRLFTLDEVELPIPKGYIDILRKTVTDLEIRSESSINDFWSDAGDRELSGFWQGKTIFQLFRPAPEGWQWQSGRCTRIQKTTRPPTQWVENWKDMNAKDKQKAIDEWAVEGPKRQAAREARGVSKLSIKDEEYDAVMKAAKEKLKVPDAPAMPLLLNALSAVSNHGKHRKNHIKHQDHIAAAGTVSPHYYALVHTPVPIPKAMKIPTQRLLWIKNGTSFKTRQPGTLRQSDQNQKSRRRASVVANMYTSAASWIYVTKSIVNSSSP